MMVLEEQKGVLEVVPVCVWEIKMDCMKLFFAGVFFQFGGLCQQCFGLSFELFCFQGLSSSGQFSLSFCISILFEFLEQCLLLDEVCL